MQMVTSYSLVFRDFCMDVKQKKTRFSDRIISFPDVRWTVLIGLILIPINCYWIIQMEAVRYSGHSTTISLLFNSVFCLFFSQIIARQAPKYDSVLLQRILGWWA